MQEPTYAYDETSDTLAISFFPGEKATGIELTDHILLRINKQEQRVIGITLLEYSVLAHQTEIGPRTFPLTGLDTLESSLREKILTLLRYPPVSDILLLAAYTPSATEIIPVISIQPIVVTAQTP